MEVAELEETATVDSAVGDDEELTEIEENDAEDEDDAEEEAFKIFTCSNETVKVTFLALDT